MTYDVVIVGAGPAGSMTALATLLESELEGTEKKVLLVDKRKELGRPVQCAGVVVKDRLDTLGLELPDEVVASEVRGAVLHGPGGSTATWDGGRTRGYVMYRDRFDQWLAAMASEAGAEIRLQEDPSRTDPPYHYHSNYLIGADGWRSQLLHEFTRQPSVVSHPGVEYLVDLENPVDTGMVHLYFGNKVAPGGYVWMFPESGHHVRVGCGVSRGHRPRQHLDKFIESGEIVGEVIGINAGGMIPVSRLLRPLTYKLMRPHHDRIQQIAVVGDAARMTDAVHGGGIFNAMLAGQYLGKVIARDGDLMDYEHWCRDDLKKELDRRFLLRQVMDGWSDSDLDAMIEVMSTIEIDEKVPINRQFNAFAWRLIRKKPGLFPKALGAALMAMFRS